MWRSHCHFDDHDIYTRELVSSFCYLRMEEDGNQHHQLFLIKGQTVVSASEGNSKKSFDLSDFSMDFVLFAYSRSH